MILAATRGLASHATERRTERVPRSEAVGGSLSGEFCLGAISANHAGSNPLGLKQGRL